MEEIWNAPQIRILYGALFVLISMLIYIYRPTPNHDPIRIPPELLYVDSPVEDPFRSPGAIERRLEDFGRHNVRISNRF